MLQPQSISGSNLRIFAHLRCLCLLQERQLAIKKAARKARRDAIKAARQKRLQKQEAKRARRALKPVWEDSTTSESG